MDAKVSQGAVSGGGKKSAPMELGLGVTLLIGGARSGKSNMALQLGLAWPGPVCFVATATAGDDDMSARIDRHQKERPGHWSLLELPTFDSAAVPDSNEQQNHERPSHEQLLILDCVTMLVANLLFADHTDDEIVDHTSDLANALNKRRGPSVVITNEVGFGVHPETSLGRRYRDTLGRANRALAEQSETSLLVVAGHVVPLRDLSLEWPQQPNPSQVEIK